MSRFIYISWFRRSPGRLTRCRAAGVNRYRAVGTPVCHIVNYQTCCCISPALGGDGRLLDLEEELGVALSFLHPLHQNLERLLRLECVQHPAQLPDDLELVG